MGKVGCVYRLMLDHLKGFVIILDGDMSAIYKSVFFVSKAYR